MAVSAPPYSEGHLVVAAIRVLEHLHRRPPQEKEVAALLQWPEEKAIFLLRGLTEEGILARVGSAYDLRYEVRDHHALEDLPQDETDPGLAADIQAFEEKMAADQAKLENLFREGDTPEKKKRISNLDDDFRRFQGGKPRDPFGGD
jgi:hypothetical protein